MRYLIYLLVCFLIFLPACTGPFDTGPGLAVISGQFSEAMRWSDFIGAGNYLRKDVRDQFLDQFPADDDLKIVESQIISVDLNVESKTAEADYQMEYYRLPSMRVKKWHWAQQWQLQQQKGMKPGVWLIVNPPPSFP